MAEAEIIREQRMAAVQRVMRPATVGVGVMDERA